MGSVCWKMSKKDNSESSSSSSSQMEQCTVSIVDIKTGVPLSLPDIVTDQQNHEQQVPLDSATTQTRPNYRYQLPEHQKLFRHFMTRVSNVRSKPMITKDDFQACEKMGREILRQTEIEYKELMNKYNVSSKKLSKQQCALDHASEQLRSHVLNVIDITRVHVNTEIGSREEAGHRYAMGLRYMYEYQCDTFKNVIN